jgi:hypothetical protein
MRRIEFRMPWLDDLSAVSRSISAVCSLEHDTGTGIPLLIFTTISYGGAVVAAPTVAIGVGSGWWGHWGGWGGGWHGHW